MHIPYPARMFVAAEPIQPTPLESTSATWVSTPDALDSMLDELREAPEIAIDLEHNNYRSYAGVVCLMQISTRKQDWIVDTLALRAELATGALNEVLTDPKVIKVRLILGLERAGYRTTAGPSRCRKRHHMVTTRF
jgi:exosome complex exonuclease RRP6